MVGKKLVACGNIIKTSSVYRWKGKIEHAAEYGAFIKTKASHYKKVERYIKKCHPYEVPEIISWPINKGSKDYLDWIDAST
jgi:periplasmic divalent cation tolerance protein